MVEEVFIKDGELLTIKVRGRSIRTTAEHPFYVRGKGWKTAWELAVGDELRSHDEQWVPVEGIEGTGERSVVYNLRVADYHTYFVGCDEWGFSVWAHNADYWKVADAAEGGFWKVTKPGETARMFGSREEAVAFANTRNAAAQAAADAAAAAAARKAAERAAARAELAKTIAGGHAKDFHLFGNNKRAFSAAGINTEAKYAQHIDLVMEKGISKQFGRGKSAYYYMSIS